MTLILAWIPVVVVLGTLVWGLSWLLYDAVMRDVRANGCRRVGQDWFYGVLAMLVLGYIVWGFGVVLEWLVQVTR